MHPTVREIVLQRGGWYRTLAREAQGVVFDFAQDHVWVKGGGAVADFDGSVQQAIDASVISFTRATDASRVNASGLIETVATGLWRREYSPLTLSPLGYLPEPARTNLAIRSEDLSTGWTISQASVSVNGATAPDGAVTMDMLVEDSNLASHYAICPATAMTSGTTYCASIFVKPNGRTNVQGTFQAGTHGSTQYVNFNLTGAGSVAASAGGAVGFITYIGNGIYRCAIACAASASASGGCAWVMQTTGGGGRLTTYQGDGASGMYMWGAQLEAGAYPTSYIPTTSASVTRNADVMTVALSKLPFSATAGTLIGAAQPSPDAATGGHFLWSVDDGTSNERIYSSALTAGQKERQGAVTDGGVVQASIQSTVSDINAARFKEAMAWAANDIQYVANGASIGTDVAATLPTVTTLRFGLSASGSDASYFAAPIESVVYLPRRLSAAEMIARTA